MALSSSLGAWWGSLLWTLLVSFTWLWDQGDYLCPSPACGPAGSFCRPVHTSQPPTSQWERQLPPPLQKVLQQYLPPNNTLTVLLPISQRNMSASHQARSVPCLLLDSLPQGRATGFFLTWVQLYMTRCPVLVFQNSKQHKTNHCPWRAYNPGKTSVNLQPLQNCSIWLTKSHPIQECLKGDRDILGAREA